MNSIIQLVVLAGIAIFLILRLRNVLGTREGFEKPPEALPVDRPSRARPDLAVIEGGPDRDIIDHATEGSPAARALAQMKRVEPAFSVTEFLTGARGAYEMILTAFDRGDLASVRPYLAPEVYDAFASVVEDRTAKGLKVDSTFVGVSKVELKDADFDQVSREAEITVQFVGEMTTVVRDAEGTIVEGSANEIRRQKDAWTFARTMGSNDPNWLLVATSE
jgi:predicted lipid-binding transport protein (Tim44 family)